MPSPSMDGGTPIMTADPKLTTTSVGDLPPLPEVVSRPSIARDIPGVEGPGVTPRTPGMGEPLNDSLPAMAGDFGPSGSVPKAPGQAESLLEPKSDFKATMPSVEERFPVPEEPMGPPASLARNNLASPERSVTLSQEGPSRSVTKAVGEGGASANPASPGSIEAKTQGILKNAQHDPGIFGSIKQYILEHPEAVALATGLAAASMGGGWKWSLAAAAAGYFGTNLFKGWNENSNKASALDKVAALHNLPTQK